MGKSLHFVDVPVKVGGLSATTTEYKTMSAPMTMSLTMSPPTMLDQRSEDLVFRDVPIDVGGLDQVKRPNNRSHHLFDEVVESDSDSDDYDNVTVPEEFIDELPSFTVFCKCRHHLWFDDVKKRPHHNQARCRVCSSLQMSCQIGWRNGVSIEHEQQELKLHNDETRRWRTLENQLHFEAKHYRTSMIVLSYDDTSALVLPKLSRRAPKGGPKGGVGFVPWNITNHGAFENHYFYTLKHVIPKGSNRINTFLYFYLRRLKMFDNCHAKCQRLVLMADNFIENKCNMLLCFLSHLIYWRWFTTIELLFGPVGHTHNGNDSVQQHRGRFSQFYPC